jgi:hypothetical protein
MTITTLDDPTTYLGYRRHIHPRPGIWVVLLDGYESGLEEEGGPRWCLWCETHNQQFMWDNQAEARDNMSTPEYWCPVCAEGKTPPDVERLGVVKDRLGQLRNEEQALMQERFELVAGLKGQGWSFRALGDVLGLSHTAVAKMLDAPSKLSTQTPGPSWRSPQRQET